ncbi:hypothetical protein Glove_441g68 [Diversispora epigaea]|uniref:Resolvase/invertase-type recombinase catalytic domain-containing protein n=1 Tax=Diversispora epigaea TaxID=1348612 RepID=A0A397GSJ2_9GLOM|nr:hypothetical protein Glove_441g68 [Diversispora epigaea]
MTSQLKHCDDGPTLEELLLSGHLAKICYARVSSEHQRDDLEQQIANLRQYYPEYKIISDIGSGLNWKCRGFVTLLERIHTEGIKKVVVTRKDRLCRFGSEFVEWIFEKNGTWLVVFGMDVSAESSEAGKLVEDLLSIVTVFVARYNGMRSAANRKRKREVAKAQEEQELQDSSRQDTTYPSLFYAREEVETQTLDGNTVEKEGIEWTKKALRAQCLNAANFNNTKLQ